MTKISMDKDLTIKTLSQALLDLWWAWGKENKEAADATDQARELLVELGYIEPASHNMTPAGRTLLKSE